MVIAAAFQHKTLRHGNSVLLQKRIQIRRLLICVAAQVNDLAALIHIISYLVFLILGNIRKQAVNQKNRRVLRHRVISQKAQGLNLYVFLLY